MKNMLLAAALLASANSAWAMQNIKLGAMDIDPFISVKQSYDTNIYLTDTGLKSSHINRTALGVNAANKFGSRLDLTGGYSMEILTYSRAASINNAVHHNANLALKAKLLSNTNLTFDDNFMQTTDQATSELVARAKRLQNTAAARMESPLRGKFGYGVDVQHTYHNYAALSYNSLDRAELLAGLNISYQLQPKTKVFLGYTYGDLRYDKKNTATNTRTNDATYGNFDLGVVGNIAPKLVGTLKAGAQFRKYKENLGTAANSIATGGYSAQLQWKPQEKTEIVIYGKRANIESAYVDSRFYTSTLTDISASREVRKVKIGLGVGFETVQYPERTTVAKPKRLDENINARITADYNIQKWLKTGVFYTYKSRASNEDASEYKDNVVGLELKGLF